VPSWTGVIASLLLVALAAIALSAAVGSDPGADRGRRARGHSAGRRRGTASGDLRPHRPTGRVRLVIVMIVIAGQVAGRRGRGLRRARWSATAGVAMGSIITLGALLALGVIAVQPRVVVPVGGMIVSGAMLASGLPCAGCVRMPSRPARPSKPGCVWGSRRGRRSCRINDRRCAPRCCPRVTGQAMRLCGHPRSSLGEHDEGVEEVLAVFCGGG
jgi:putative ABC transport system permease protein